MEAEYAKRLVASRFGAWFAFLVAFGKDCAGVLRPVGCSFLNGELRWAPFGYVGGDGRDGALVGRVA